VENGTVIPMWLETAAGWLPGPPVAERWARLLDVTMNPDPNGLPGASVLQQLTNGLGSWALVLSLAGLLIGAAAWALGSHSQNYHQSMIGRRAVLVSGLAALLVGAAPALVNFFFNAGTRVR
jgi:hypothetical protein